MQEQSAGFQSIPKTSTKLVLCQESVTNKREHRILGHRQRTSLRRLGKEATRRANWKNRVGIAKKLQGRAGKKTQIYQGLVLAKIQGHWAPGTCPSQRQRDGGQVAEILGKEIPLGRQLKRRHFGACVR